MVNSLKVLLLGCEQKGKPLEKLNSPNFEVRKLPASDHSREALCESAKWCDLLFIGAEKNRAYILADEIWHLLRRRLVVSLTEGLSIQALRDLYPLSKVSRCYVYPDLPTDRAVFLLSLDNTYSSTEAGIVKELLCGLGDSLLVGEETLETLHSRIGRAQNLIIELIDILSQSVDQDRDLYEYVLGWVLYGTGLATVKGMETMPLEARQIPPETLEKIRRLLKETL